MKRLILLTLASLAILFVCVGCSEDESEPVITRIVVTPECGVADLRVDVFGAASGGDESGPATGGANNLEYSWDFGDGTSASTSIAYHVYDTPGEYTVRLSVKDPDGKSATAERFVTVIGDSMTIEGEFSPAAPSVGEQVSFDFRAMSCAIDPDTPGDYRNLVQSWYVVNPAGTDTFATYLGKDPTHTFLAPGTWTVHLQVSFPAWAVVRKDVLTIDVN